MGWLVISRRLNERIIAGEVEILIADIRTNKEGHAVVDIALKGPKELKFLRKEIYKEDLRKNGNTIRNKS